MILFDLVGRTEDNALYRKLESSNTNRQLDFLDSIIQAALETERPFLSQAIIKALNYHAISCLHPYAGQYRPCRVNLRDGHTPPEPHCIPGLMDDFVNLTNQSFVLGKTAMETIATAAWVLWRLNWIHPFINGNGRTARAACYFVLCAKKKGRLSGRTTLPILLKEHRKDYIEALQKADQGDEQIALQSLIAHLIVKQVQS